MRSLLGTWLRAMTRKAAIGAPSPSARTARDSIETCLDSKPWKTAAFSAGAFP